MFNLLTTAIQIALDVAVVIDLVGVRAALAA